MKSTTIITSIALLLSTGLSSCFKENIGCVTGRGEVVKETRFVESIHKVQLNGSADIILIPTSDLSETEIEISAQDEIIEVLETEVIGDKLVIDYKQNCIKTKKDVLLRIKTAQLSELKINGSVDVESEGSFSGDKLKFIVNGSGDIDFDLDYNRTEVDIDGSGDVELNGKSSNLNIDVEGSGNVDAKELQSQDCDVHIQGSGDVKVHANKSLKIRIEGSGNVGYRGTASPEISIDGSGDAYKL